MWTLLSLCTVLPIVLGSDMVDCNDGRHCKTVVVFRAYCPVYHCSEGMCQVPNCPVHIERDVDCQEVFCTGHKRKDTSTVLRDWFVAILCVVGFTAGVIVVGIWWRRRASLRPVQRREEEARLLDHVTFNRSSGLVQISLDADFLSYIIDDSEQISEEEREEFTRHQEAILQDQMFSPSHRHTRIYRGAQNPDPPTRVRTTSC